MFPTSVRRLSSSPRKKALIIGIGYSNTTAELKEEYAPLLSPHKDARDFKQLLIDIYGYNEGDIVLMLDDGSDHAIRPTRKNMEFQLRALVRGAQAGDVSVLWFSGHSEQIPNKTNSERDGYDEALLPVDHNGKDVDHLILDNLLRKILVNPLPVGVRLMTFFDTCHSGTMLDLPHYKCNKIPRSKCVDEIKWKNMKYFPKRRKALGRLLASLVVLLFMDSLPAPVIRTRRKSTDESEGIYISLIKSPAPLPRRRLRLAAVEKPNSRSSEVSSGDRFFQDIVASSSRVCYSPIERCLSPTTFVAECDGKCLPGLPLDAEKPDVYSISACSDTQLTFEDYQGGNSFTQDLITYLRIQARPPLGDLMRHLTKERSKVCQCVCQSCMVRLREAVGPSEKRQIWKEVSFSRPKLGTEKRIKLDEPFEM
ncbi:peptidase C14 [Obba rivulosa]|uniref:Peptidase C14 n=1 Tax=Obba rivulosa TaxID=1052685 RepID=A0A8E2DQU9_9APHY|nr:peptidase C14 [Obba rivulosa]